jgi:hypothetical protein
LLGCQLGVNTISLNAVENGRGNPIASAQASIDADEWHRIEVDWFQDNQINMTVTDSTGQEVGSLSVVDSRFSDSTGVAWVGSDDFGNEVRWDNLRIVNR